MSENEWDQVDWDRLRRLRALFLDPSSIDGPYWRDEEDLRAYDLTFGARIGWKWDNVLAELKQRSWLPPSTHIYDWGCGTGIAARRLLAAFPDHPWSKVSFWDYSSLATGFARNQIETDLPSVTTEVAPPDRLDPDSIVLISHALGEATEEDLRVLWEKVREARAVIVVEPGTHASSRGIIAVREALKSHFRIIAPCTHAETCGLLTEENSRHWCHHFGRVPTEAFMDTNWSRFSRTLEIDLRSLPFSFLALDRSRLESPDTEASRILGRPRFYKGFCRILSCQTSGVCEYELQKRTDKQLWKTLKKDRHSGRFVWKTDANRIVGYKPDPTD